MVFGSRFFIQTRQGLFASTFHSPPRHLHLHFADIKHSQSIALLPPPPAVVTLAAIAISNRSKHQPSNGKSVKVVGAKISGHVGRLTRNDRRRLHPDSQALSSVRLMAVCRRGVSTNAAGAADACGHEGIVEPGPAALRAAEGAVVESHAAEGRREWGWGVLCGLFR
jgi:hypothetical protein